MQPSALELTQMTGLQQLSLIRDGDVAPPGIATLLGMTLEEIDEGRAVFSLTTRADMTNPMGGVHGGIAATILDSVMGCAVHTTMAPGESYTTADLTVHYTRSIRVDTGVITATGSVLHRGRTTATAEGKVHDADGRLLAHGTTTCVIRSIAP